jgi:hypothetical protein
MLFVFKAFEVLLAINAGEDPCILAFGLAVPVDLGFLDGALTLITNEGDHVYLCRIY